MNNQSEITETAEDALNKLSGGHVLDVATGGGGFINFLMENLLGYTEITGIDCNEHPLETARKVYGQENIHFQRMDAARMDFPNSHFNTVCIANSLHHMADPPNVLSEMMRVCKPGGHIIISEMYRDGQSETQLTHVLLHHWWAAVDNDEGITHHETFTRQEIIDITGKLGLHHIKYYESKDLETNPRDPELIRELDGIIDRFIQRSQALAGGVELCQRGEELRQRVHEVGFQGATTLLAIGEK
jgi:ubiquinone/menaquinone biosynthesis C-methylase UbiE